MLLLLSLFHLSGNEGKRVRGKANQAFAVYHRGSCALQNATGSSRRAAAGEGLSGQAPMHVCKLRDLQLLEVLAKAPH